MTYRGRHRADASEGFSVHGRANRGVPAGESAERTGERYDQALADQHAREHQARHGNGER